ncbi:MAG: metabolite traffic protein EboE [Lentisphaeria bacterium]|nr:metabolite traffic protein EboE [Lentisphaeria bacterium]
MNTTHHISYCTNIHAYNSVDELICVLNQQVSLVAKGLSFPISAGLYLSNAVVNELIDCPQNLVELQQTLVEKSLYVCSLNCFPYGKFHNQVIKEKVYYPDWGNRERVEYTKKAGWVLDQLLPSGVSGTISTVPVTYGKVLPTGALCNLEETLSYFGSELNHTIYLALEPEPDCYLDDTESTISFFDLAKQTLTPLAYSHLGLCFDTCHFSVLFENPKISYQKLRNHGVCVPKVQISASLVTKEPVKLREFAEPIYLHQTSVLQNKTIYRFSDLDKALASTYFNDAEWRVHFHIPIYLKFTKEGLGTTQDDLIVFLEMLRSETQIHVEVETYALSVIPGVSISAVESTVKELNFLNQYLNIN